MIYKTHTTQNKILRLTQKSIQTEIDGKQIYLLKKRWKDQKLLTNRLKKILSQKAFAGKVVKKEKKRNMYIIKLDNLDYRTLDSFINKILNEAIIIKKLEIERFSENKASVSMECAI